MTSPINSMIDAAMRCGKCGEARCDCYKECSCGWYAEKGKPCNNPETEYCSTKVWNAPPRGDLRKGDRVRLDANIPWSPVGATYSSGYHGTVAATPRKGSEYVGVRWDGRTSVDRIRSGWLEKP